MSQAADAWGFICVGAWVAVRASFTHSILSLERAADSTVEAIGGWRNSKRKAEDHSDGFIWT